MNVLAHVASGALLALALHQLWTWSMVTLELIFFDGPSSWQGRKVLS